MRRGNKNEMPTPSKRTNDNAAEPLNCTSALTVIVSSEVDEYRRAYDYVCELQLDHEGSHRDGSVTWGGE